MLPFAEASEALAALAEEMTTWPGVTAATVDASGPPGGRELLLTIRADSYDRLHEAWTRAAGRINSGIGFAYGASEQGKRRMKLYIESRPEGPTTP